MVDPALAKDYFDKKLKFTTGPVEVEDMIKTGANMNLIDVREAEDFHKGHVPGAINLPREQWATLEGLSKDRMNIIYCYNQQCHLGAKACYEFASSGFPVMEMEGGFEMWKERDLEIEHPAENRLAKLFHGIGKH
jgi:rhodanese-related sulfurtransferase